MRARARCTDPVTSHEAAAAVEAIGGAASQRDRCLQVVRATPGRTAAEIARAADMERHVPSRRLPELRDAGLVRNDGARICDVTGTRSMLWWPVFSELLFEP